jgi:hypothetical protein
VTTIDITWVSHRRPCALPRQVLDQRIDHHLLPVNLGLQPLDIHRQRFELNGPRARRGLINGLVSLGHCSLPDQWHGWEMWVSFLEGGSDGRSPARVRPERLRGMSFGPLG